MIKNKFYFIELLRFFSSLMVVVWHYQHFFLPYNRNNLFNLEDYQNDIINILYTSKLGTHGVYIFFCISGIVFSYNYLNKVTDFKIFFFKRFSRLYPLHILTLFIVCYIQFFNFQNLGNYQIYDYNDLKHFILNLLFISAWGFEDGSSYNGPIWSVSIEIIVYFIFFYLISFLSKSNYLLPLLIIFISIILKKNISNHELFNALTLFFSGNILFNLYKSNKLLILALITVLFILFNFIGNYKILFTCIGICAFFLLLETLKLKPILKKSFSILGDLTYASYLIHVPIQLILIYYISEYDFDDSVFYNLNFFFSFLFFVYCLSYLVFKFYEKPADRFLKKKFILRDSVKN